MQNRITSRTLVVCAAASLAGLASAAHANLVIIPTFGSSVTSDPNAVNIMAGINAAITQMQNKLLDNVTVRIDFESVNTGLGESSTFINSATYAAIHNDLLTKQTLSANDTTALATLAATGANNPVNGSTGMTLPLPLLRRLGEAAGNNGTNIDSTISLKTSICNAIRTGTQDPNKYDLEQVALHEITEVLGAGGGGSNLGSNSTDIGSLDLYRFSAPGVRSYSTSASTAYFSINGGTTNLSNFNQNGGGDYADWGGPNALPQVQDAFSTPGIQLDLDSTELTALDVVGWDLAPVPEPTTLSVLAIAGAGLLARRRRERNA